MAQLMPAFPLGTVLFPGAMLPLRIFEPRYRQLVADLLEQPEPRTFGVVAIREGREVGADGVRALYDVGCLAQVTELRETSDGRYAVLTVGTRRFRLGQLDHSHPYLQADVDWLAEIDGVGDLTRAATAVRASFLDYARLLGTREAGELALPDEPRGLSYAVASALPLPIGERQSLLEAPDDASRLATERELLNREIGLLRHLRAAPLPDPTQIPRSLN